MLRLALTYSMIVLLFDLIAASISKAAAINYGNFALLAFAIYFFLGVYAGRTLHSWRALGSVLIAAAVDATLGAYLAALMGPGRPATSATEVEIVFYGFAAIAVATIIGAIGVAVGLRAGRAAGPT